MAYTPAQKRPMMADARKPGMSQGDAKKMRKKMPHKQRSTAMRGPVKRSVLS